MMSEVNTGNKIFTPPGEMKITLRRGGDGGKQIFLNPPSDLDYDEGYEDGKN